MKILALDTSTKAGSACILEDENLIGEIFFNLEKTHSERILPIIDYILNFANLSLSEIDLFVCGIGPGSFTGIRIGLAIAKGFSFSLKKPLVGISSLDALAYEFYNEKEYISIIEGRNKEYFYAIYKWDKNDLVKISDYHVTSIKGLPKIDNAIIIENSLFIKNSSNNLLPFKKIFKGNLFSHNYGILGYKKFIKGNFSKEVNPLYLKPSDAEINLHSSLK